MFRPSEIIISAFIDSLSEEYKSRFGSNKKNIFLLQNTSHTILSQYALSDALYHNLDHVLVITNVAKDIIKGKIIADGDVTEAEWINFIISVLAFNVGFVRGALKGDSRHQIILNKNKSIKLPEGSTDGALWPFAIERSQLFVKTRLAKIKGLDIEAISTMIEFGNFPPSEQNAKDLNIYCDMLRAAHLIGIVADPNFSLKIRRLILEMEEAHLNPFLKYSNVKDFRKAYPSYFWKKIHPLITDACWYLKYSSDGLEWLSIMHSHLLIDEHGL